LDSTDAYLGGDEFFTKGIIVNDTIYVEYYRFSRKSGIEFAFKIPHIWRVFGVIGDSVVHSVHKRGLSPDLYHYGDYFSGTPMFLRYGPQEDSTGYLLLRPKKIVYFDQSLRIPYLKYYLDGAPFFKRAEELDSLRKSPPNDTIGTIGRFWDIHPIFGYIESPIGGRLIDSIYFLKGSYDDIKLIEKRLGIR
jgi:hypothetical protein